MKVLVLIISIIGFLSADITDFYKANKEPLQTKINPIKKRKNGFKLDLIYKFEIEARVLSAQKYNWDDLASIMTHDLGVSWGTMSETRIFNQFIWDQANRFLIYSIPEFKLDKLGGKDYINSHVANIHLIPKDWTVENKLNKIKKYDIVKIKGYLTDVRKNNKVVYTSITRNDKGAGACEVIYVEDVEIIHSRTNNSFYYQEEKGPKLRDHVDFSKFSKPGEGTRAYKKGE